MNWRNIHIQNPYRFQLPTYPQGQELKENSRADRPHRYTPTRKRSESSQLFANISSSSISIDKMSKRSVTREKKSLKIEDGVRKNKKGQVIVPKELIESLQKQIDKLIYLIKTSFSTYKKYIKNLENMVKGQVTRINKQMTQKLDQISKIADLIVKQKDSKSQWSFLSSQIQIKNIENIGFESPQETKKQTSLRSTIDSNYRFDHSKNPQSTRILEANMKVTSFETDNNKELIQKQGSNRSSKIESRENNQRKHLQNEKGRIGNIGIEQSLKKINFSMKSLASILRQRD